MKDVFIQKSGKWYYGNKEVSIAEMYKIRYGRQFSPEEIERCERREAELREQLKQYKEQGYKVVKLMTPPGHGKAYQDLIGACFYIKDLLRKKFLTVHPFASNYYVPCENYGVNETREMCGCTKFIWKPSEWF